LSSVVDYTIGIRLNQSENQTKRKLLLIASLVVNLGFLGFFKYYNFFVDTFVDAFSSLGIHLNTSSLNIILPVGISFYTFQTLSYTIDIYRKKIQPTRDVIAFFAYVSFFPQLVAGPIERASNLLPQFFEKRTVGNVQKNRHRRQLCGHRRCGVFGLRGAQFDNIGDSCHTVCLSDLRRFFGLFGYCHWYGEVLWFQADDQFFGAVLFA